ncbi:MAG: hypothetical protein WC254_06910 [Candidatus Woesearchaeota archaeon]|jgi:DNA repair exonuclease SbcCD ATPase subunit
MNKPHSSVTGDLKITFEKTISILSPEPVLSYFTKKDVIVRYLEEFKKSLEVLSQIETAQKQQEAAEEGENQQHKHTKEEIERMVKSLDKHSRSLLEDARQQKKRFENVKKEQFISSKDTNDIEAKIKKIEDSIVELHKLQQQMQTGSPDASQLSSIKSQISTYVDAIKTLLEEIKSDINLEKRLGRTEIRLLNLFIQSHRKLLASSQEFKTEIKGVVDAFSNKREAAQFMEKLTTAQHAVREFIDQETQSSAVERIGTFMQERNKIEEEIVIFLDQLKTDLKSEGEIHPELDMFGSRLHEYRESLVRSEEAIIVFFQNETGHLNKSFDILEKLEKAINDVFKALVPSAIKRTINSIFGNGPE